MSTTLPEQTRNPRQHASSATPQAGSQDAAQELVAEELVLQDYLATMYKRRELRSSVGTLETGRQQSTARGDELPSFDWIKQRSGWSDTPRARFVLKNEWIGRVEGVDDGYFTATLASRQAPGELDQAEIDIDELSPADRDRLRPGAVFYWVVGYRDEPHGQRLGVSSILFRNMVPPTEAQLTEVDRETNELLEFFGDAPSELH